MNSIIKSVFKINPGASSEESSGKKKANSQAKPANGKATFENEEQVQQGYTILKKEVQEEMVSEIAQLSIQDCKDVTEVAIARPTAGTQLCRHATKGSDVNN